MLSFDRKERVAIWAGLTVILIGLALRLWLAWRYPTVPVSDFLGVVEFGTELSHNLGAKTWHWLFLGPGTSTLLAGIFDVVPGDPAKVARISTVLLMSSLPLMPLLMLRGIVATWARMLCAALIALSPAHIVFSQVIAQDNWVQAPTLALACLGVRNAMGKGRGFPAWGALLWLLAGYIRQEMWLAALPLLLLAAFPWRQPATWLRHVTVVALISVALLGLIGLQRYKATDRFALTTNHGGAAMLGSYMPGAGFGWVQYDAYVAAKHPELAGDAEKLARAAGPMAWQEIQKRPWFHLQRRVGALFASAVNADGTLLYWSMMADAQSPERRPDALVVASHLTVLLTIGLCLLHIGFLTAFVIACRTKNWVILAVSATIALKVLLHVLFATQARFMLVVDVLEAIAIGLAAIDIVMNRAVRPLGLLALVTAAATVFGVVWVLPRWEAAVRKADPGVEQNTFVMQLQHAQGTCAVRSGLLVESMPSMFRIKVAHPDPAPGETAEVDCMFRAVGGDNQIVLGVEDGYAPGGFPDRMRQEVRIGDRQLLAHDFSAEAGAGWWETTVPLSAHSGTHVVVTIRAIRPDAGPAWGDAALTRVRIRNAP